MDSSFKLKVNNKVLELPSFFPDATFGTVRALSPSDIRNLHIQGLCTTSLPAHSYKVTELAKNFGSFSNFLGTPDLPILTDSGGFQLQVFIHIKGKGKINPKKWVLDDGAFMPDLYTNQKIFFTPELSQQIQFDLKSDMRVVLDEPVPFGADYHYMRTSIDRTLNWAQKSKDEFLRLENLEASKFNAQSDCFVETAVLPRPMLFAVSQGAQFEDLRKECTQKLNDIGFDGIGWGGSCFDETTGKIDSKSLEIIRKYTPDNKIVYGMGVGNPDDIILFNKIGATLFDCVIPTRNARHGYLFVSKGQGENFKADNYDVVHISTSRYLNDKDLIDPLLAEMADYPEDCKVSRSLLRHLFKIKDISAQRIATMHNLYFYKYIIRNFCKFTVN